MALFLVCLLICTAMALAVEPDIWKAAYLALNRGRLPGQPRGQSAADCRGTNAGTVPLRALLLAAGFGTRLRPITEQTPKCLVPIHGRPLLDYWLDMLLDGDIEHAVVNTHYLSEKVEVHVRASRWAARTTLVHEPVLLGTGGTVLKNRDALADGAFLVAHADNLCTFDVGAFIAAHAGRPNGVDITMMTFVTDTPESCGIVECNTEGRVIAFHEKVRNPPGRVANGAVYILEPSVIDFLAGLRRTVIDLSTEVIPHFLGRIITHPNDGYLRDIGTPEALAAAHREFRS